jgi:hypothetical protein
MQSPSDLDRSARPTLSPYEAELQRGRVAFEFPPSLEREYRKFHLQRVLPRVRGWLWVLVALTLATGIYRLGYQGNFGFNFETVLRIGVLQCASIAMLLAAYHPRHEQLYPGTAALASALYGVALSVLVLQVIMEGGAETLSLLTVHTLATLFLVGLMFVPALIVASLILVAFIAAGFAFELRPTMLAYDTVLVA